MPKLDYDSLVSGLEACGNNCKCKEVDSKLENAGFTVRPIGGHRVYSHSGIQNFAGGNYNCGHGKNPQVSAIYVGKVVKTLRLMEADLREFLGKEK